VVDSLFERLLVAGKMENPAVCAILGGILGQVASFILLSSYSTFIMLKFLSSEIIIVL
jgi:positive regulator of sigma E activity